jgi:hypothetical protein
VVGGGPAVTRVVIWDDSPHTYVDCVPRHTRGRTATAPARRRSACAAHRDGHGAVALSVAQRAVAAGQPRRLRGVGGRAARRRLDAPARLASARLAARRASACRT